MPDLRIELEPSSQAPQRARQAIRREFSDRLPANALYDLGTVVTELVDNSVEHGPGKPIAVRITLGEDGVVRGDVADGGQGVIAIRDMNADADGGLGLRIVDGLADRWGVHDQGNRVWFELAPPD